MRGREEGGDGQGCSGCVGLGGGVALGLGFVLVLKVILGRFGAM